jgi:flagellar biosynthesis protein FlhF
MIKTYKGTTFTEVFLRIKEEIGPDAVILKQQEIKNPASPSEKVEVTVTLDDIAELPAAMPSSIDNKSGKIEINEKSIGTYNNRGVKHSTVKFTEQGKPADSNKFMDYMENALAEIRALREDFAITRGEFLEGIRVVRDRVPKEFGVVATELSKIGIPAQTLQDLLAEVMLNCPVESRDERSVREQMKRVLANRIAVAPRPRLRKGRPIVQMFVGPAGCGKSGVISKLAGRATITGNTNVAIVTADSYRMGALEQMEAFASAAEIELGVISSPDEVPEVFGKLREKSLLLIDTAGRSLSNAEHEREMLAFYETIRPDEVHLVLPLNMRDRDLEKFAELYSKIHVNRFVFTKQDESSELGALVWLPVKFGVPISYISNGQGPDNIVSAEKEIIASWLLK